MYKKQLNRFACQISNKMTSYIPIPLRICKYAKDNPGHHLSYCKNKGLLYAISLIGTYRGAQSRKSAYKRGVDYLYEAMNKHPENYFHISKTEIRRLIYPSNKKKHCLNLPFRSIEILQAVVQYIDNPSDSVCRINCKEMRRIQCNKRNIPGNSCFGYLVHDLREQLAVLKGSMDEESKMREIAEFLLEERYTPKCN